MNCIGVFLLFNAATTLISYAVAFDHWIRDFLKDVL